MSRHPYAFDTRNEGSKTNKKNNLYFNGTQWIVNPWYGWQPKVSSFMQCSWQDCIMKKVQDCNACRDSVDEWNENSSLVVPHLELSSPPNDDEWIPDVTMLRRMYMDGHDANGNPWPPPLDDDLCKVLGNNQKTKQVLDAKGSAIPRFQQDSNPRVFCMIYTIVEESHATQIRAI